LVIKRTGNVSVVAANSFEAVTLIFAVNSLEEVDRH